MATQGTQGSDRAQISATKASTDGDAQTLRRNKDKQDSPLLSPVALAALGLAGAAHANVSSERTALRLDAQPVPTPDAQAAAVVAEAVTTDPVLSQLTDLIQHMAQEGSAPAQAQDVALVSDELGLNNVPSAVDAALAEQAGLEQVAQADAPQAQGAGVQLALAGDAPLVLADASGVAASSGSGAATTATTATTTAATTVTTVAGMSMAGALAVLGGVVAVAAGAGGGGSSSSTSASVGGVVSDGLISGADVYVDMNDNGKVDEGDVKVGTTKADGSFTGTLSDVQKTHALLAVGGTDISTGLAFKGMFTAPAGSTVITPLTTLIQELVSQGSSATAAKTQVAEALGLSTSVDLTTYNAVAGMVSGDGSVASGVTQAQAIEIQSKALMVANIIATGTAALSGAVTAAGGSAQTTSLSTNVVSALVTAIKTDGQVNLTSSSTLQQVMNTAVNTAKETVALDDTVASSGVTAATSSIASANDLINTVAGSAARAAETQVSSTASSIVEALTQMVQVQQVVQNTVADKLDDGTVSSANDVSTSYGSLNLLLSAANNVTGVQLTNTVAGDTERPADTTAPTVVSVTGSATTTPFNAGDKIDFVVTLSEGVSVSGAPILNITVNGQPQVASYVAARSTGSSLVFSYTVQASDGDGSVAVSTLSLNGATIQDLAGNSADVTLNSVASGWTVDNTAPTVAIATNVVDNGINASGGTTLTFTLSETTSDFTAADLTVQGGSISNFTRSAGDAKIYTATFTPTANSQQAASVQVKAGAFADSAGNASTASNVVGAAIDTVAPSVTITSSKSGTLKVGDTATITFDLSEDAAASGFTRSDITVSGGTLGALTQSSSDSTIYTATFTPSSSVETSAVISVAAGSFSDAAGNANTVGSLSFGVDTAKPVAQVTDNVNGTASSSTGQVAYTYTFSEAVTGLAADDFTVTNGTVASVTGSGTTWTVNVTPSADVASGNIVLTLKTGAVSDAAGNSNVSSTNTAQALDTLAPSVSSVTDNVSGTANGSTSAIAYTYTFSEAVTGLAADDFTVTNGSISSVSGSGTTWTVNVTPDSGVASGSIGLALKAAAVQDAVGNSNAASSSSDQAIDTLAPTVSSVTDNVVATANASTGNVAYTYTFSEAVTGLAADDFTVTNGSVSSVTGSGTSWTVNVTPASGVASGTIGLALKASAVQDAAGNANGASSSNAQALDTVAPTVSSYAPEDNGMSLGLSADLKLTFSEVVSKGTGNVTLYKGDGTVVETIAVSSSQVSISGSQVSINPTADLVKDQAYYVKVDVGAFVDAAGNNYAGISDATTWNFTGAGATVSINTVSTDGYVNSSEAGSVISVMGSLIAESGVLADYRVADMTAVLHPASGSDISLSNLSYDPSTGAWSAEIAKDALSGAKDYDLNVTFTGSQGMAAGIIGLGTSTVHVDTVAPTVAVTVDDSALKSGETATLTLTFSELPAILPSVTLVGAGSVGALMVNAQNPLIYTVQVTPSSNVASGAISFTLGAWTDVAGNAGSTSGSLPTLSVDTLAPTVSSYSPVDGGLSLGLASDLRLSFSEAMSKGTGNITLYKGDGTVVETIAVSSNQVSINPTADLVKDQAYYVKVAAGALLDAAGNSYAGISDSTTWNFTGAGATVSINAVSGDGYVNSSEAGAAITVTGTLVAESAVLADYRVADMTAVLHPASGSDISLSNLSYDPSTGAWSGQIAQGALSGSKDYDLNVTFTGSQGAAVGITGAGTSAVHVDTVAPTVVVGLTDDALIVGETATVSLTFSEAPAALPTVTCVGAGTLGNFVQVSTNPVVYFATLTPTANVNAGSIGFSVGSWTDMAGNAGSLSGSTPTVAVDTLAPTTTVSGVHFSADSGSSSTDFITNVEQQTVTATLSAPLATGEVLMGSVDGGRTWHDATDTVSGTAITITNVTLEPGSNSMLLKVMDAAGNTGTVASQSYVFDRTAPTTTITTVAISNDTGTSSSDFITNTATQTISATLSAALATGEKLMGSLDGGLSWVDLSSNVSGTSVAVSGATLNAGTNAMMMKVVDAAGNDGAVKSQLYTLDTSAPSTPVITAITDNGGSAADRLTNDTTPVLTVTAEAGGRVFLGQNGQALASGWTATETSSGVYTVTVTSALADGGYGLVFRDAAGNASATPVSGQPETFRIDATVPSAITVSVDVTNQNLVFNNQESGATLEASADGSTWTSFDPNTSIPDAVDFTRYYRQVDSAGNASPASSTAYTVFSGTPSADSFNFSSKTNPVYTGLDDGNDVAVTGSGNDVILAEGGNDTITAGLGQDTIDLGSAGSDVIKLTSASDSTVAAPDFIYNFGSGDKLDLSALLGSAGVGYTSTQASASSSSFLHLTNGTLTTQTISGTPVSVVQFDVQMNSGRYNSEQIAGLTLDLDYSVANVTGTSKLVINNIATFTDSNGDAQPMWNYTSGVSTNSQSGVISMAANFDTLNPVVDSSHSNRAFSVKLTLNTVVDSFSLSYDGAKAQVVTTQAAGGTAGYYLSAEDGGLSVGNVAALTVVQDSGSLSTVGNNELHLLATYDQSSNTTHLQMQYDTDKTASKTLSSVIAMDFYGNVAAQLVPDNLTLI